MQAPPHLVTPRLVTRRPAASIQSAHCDGTDRLCAVWWLLLGTVGFGALSALVPGIPIELWLGGVGALTDSVGVWTVALAASVGHSVGKLPWYALGRWSVGWPWMRRQLEKPAVGERYEALVQWMERHPAWGHATMFASAVVGVPPLAVFIVVAGQLRMSVVGAMVSMTVGRTLRFAAILGAFTWAVDLVR